MKLHKGNPGLKLAQCKTCKQNIHFINSKKSGTPIPCNLKKITGVTAKGEIVQVWESHFATCPQADQHRRRGK